MYRWNVAYPWLSNWTCLQWTLHSQHTQRTSAFSAMRGSDALFPNDFGDDLIVCYAEVNKNKQTVSVSWFAIMLNFLFRLSRLEQQWDRPSVIV